MKMIDCSGCDKEYEHELFDENPTCPHCSEPYYSKEELESKEEKFDNEGIIFGDGEE